MQKIISVRELKLPVTIAPEFLGRVPRNPPEIGLESNEDIGNALARAAGLGRHGGDLNFDNLKFPLWAEGPM